MATVVPIMSGLPQASESMMTWETQGQIMMLFSVVIFFGQLFQVVVASAIAKSANDGKHVEMEDALKTFIFVLIPSLVGRVIAGAAWSFGRVESGDNKKGNRMVALFQTVKGNVLLLILSSISTFTTAILLGAFSPKWSVLYESRNVDSTNNVKLLVGSSIALGCVCALETLYSHGKFFVRSNISAAATTANATLISILMFLLAALFGASLGINAYLVWVIQDARKLSPASGYEAKATLLRAALDRAFVVAMLGMVANGVTAVLYLLKYFFKSFDTARLARMLKLTCSSVAVFAAAALYGGTLPKLSYIGTYESSGKLIYDENSNPLFKVTSFTAVNFFVLFGVVAIAHILAFARAQL